MNKYIGIALLALLPLTANAADNQGVSADTNFICTIKDFAAVNQTGELGDEDFHTSYDLKIGEAFTVVRASGVTVGKGTLSNGKYYEPRVYESRESYVVIDSLFDDESALSILSIYYPPGYKPFFPEYYPPVEYLTFTLADFINGVTYTGICSEL